MFEAAKDTYWSNKRDGVNLQNTPTREVRHECLFPRFIAWIHADELSGRKRKAGSHSTIVLGLFFSGKNHGVEYVDMVEWMIWFLRDGDCFLRNIITASGNTATPRKKRKEEKKKEKSMSTGIVRIPGNYLFLFLSISLTYGGLFLQVYYVRNTPCGLKYISALYTDTVQGPER